MVVSQSRDAALAGVAVLDAGGNAVDAAVATALALAAVEPWNSGLGGIGFALVHRAGEARAEVVDFGPRAPGRLDASRFPLTGKVAADLFGWPEVEGDRNVHGPLSFAIPSAPAGYAFMLERWGRLPLADVIAPAQALARRGLPQDWFTTLKVASQAALLRLYPESARIYLPGGLPPVPPYQGVPGAFRLGALPDTLDRLAAAGLRDFYEGDVAASIVRDVRAMGGMLDADDLRGCQARVTAAQEVPFGRPGAAARGRADRLADRCAGARVDGRRHPARGRMRRGSARWPGRCARPMPSGSAGLGDAEPAAAESCTTHLVTCDADGTAVADDLHPAVLHGQPGRAAGLGRADEQRDHVVRPATRPAELDRPRQAPAHEHAAADPGRGRPAGADRRRLRRAADHGCGAADAVLHCRVRDGPGNGRASPADRRLQPGDDHRRPAPPRGCARSAAARTGRSSWWSMRCCRSTSPIPA